MPDRMKAWEERSIYLSGLYTFAFNGASMFKESKLPGRTTLQTISEITDRDEEVFDNTETKTKFELMEELTQKVDGVELDRATQRLFGMYKGSTATITTSALLGTEEGLKNMEEFVGDLISALREKAEQTKDPVVKRYYNEFADLGDPTKGNYTQAILTSPYLVHFVSTVATGLNTTDHTPEEIREGLGEDLFQAMFRSTESYINEFRVEYHRQALEKNWNKEAEQQYLKELYAAHEECLRSFDNLGKFSDDPEHATSRLLGNNLSHDLGRGEGGGNRGLVGVMGWFQGEMRAIENGWGADELSVLGTIGMLDADSERNGNLVTGEAREGLTEFRTAITKLKNEIWNTHVETATEKKAMADRVIAFINAQDSPFARRTMQGVKARIRKLEVTSAKLNAEATRDAETDRQHIDEKTANHPAYVKKLLQQALKTGDFKLFVQEYSVGIGAVMDPNLPKERRDAYGDFLNDVTTSDAFVLNTELQKKLVEEIVAQQMRARVEFARTLEEKAENIRTGREAVDPAYQLIKGNYYASQALARREMEHTRLSDLEVGLGLLSDAVTFDIKIHRDRKRLPTDIEKYASDLGDKYLENACDSLTPEQRKYYFEAAKTLTQSSLNDFGLLRGGQQQEIDPEKTVAVLEQTLVGTTNYWDKFKEMQAAAKEQLEELRKLKDFKKTAAYEKINDKVVVVDASLKDEKSKEFTTPLPKDAKRNSAAFMRMYHSLEKVAALNSHATPGEVTRALREMGEASEGYERKIRKQLFAGHSDNGKARVEMAKKLQELSKEHGETLGKASIGVLSPNERIADQGKRAKETLDSVKEYVKEREAAAKAAEAGRQTELAQNEPKKENAQQAGM